MPAELQAQAEKPNRSNRALWRTISALVVLAVLVAIVVWQGIARGLLLLPSQLGESTSTPTLTELPVSPSKAIPTLTSTSTLLPTPTTQLVLELGLETPLGLNKEFIIHMVTEGESLERLANNFGTTVQLIQAVNYNLPSPLMINSFVVIPAGKLNLQGIPAFETYMIVISMTVDELAQIKSVDASALCYYNGLNVDYRLSPGDWLLVPRGKINP